jgi:hypothetical protein
MTLVLEFWKVTHIAVPFGLCQWRRSVVLRSVCMFYMPPMFLLFLVKTNVINVNSRVRKIIVPLMSVTCSEKLVCSYSILKGRWSWELMERENVGVKQHRPFAMFAVCYVSLCKADRSFTTTHEYTKTLLISVADNLLLLLFSSFNYIPCCLICLFLVICCIVSSLRDSSVDIATLYG